MADPISILGATASIITIIDVLSKSISLLDSLRNQWNTADLTLLSLTSQLGALNAALVKIHEWQESGVAELHHQLDMDLKCSLDCCHILASKVYGEIADLEKAPGGTLLKTAKARLTFKRSGLSELQIMMDRQTLALNLLLTACNSNSLTKQREILEDSNVRKRMSIIQRDTASLISLVDSSSFMSTDTEKSSKLSMLFDFDDELFTSKPYKNLIRKTVKFSIRFQKRPGLSGPSDAPAGIPSNTTGPGSSDASSQSVRDSQFSKEILLLGGSSKTTFLKQMESIYSHDSLTDTYDWLEWKIIIYDNLRTAFRLLLSDYCKYFGEGPPLAMSMQRIMKSGPQDSLPPKFSEVLPWLFFRTEPHIPLFKDAGEILQSLDYFIKHLSRLCAQGYRPSNEDVIHARVRTTGIHRHVIQTSHNKYAVYDVGGERSERKKWIYGLEKRPEVTIFFAPISGYGQTLYEDQNGDQMMEALVLFESLANTNFLTHSKLILCFTKMDVFERDIRTGRSPIRENKYFRDCPGQPTDVTAGRDFITAKFTRLLQYPRDIYIYYLDATNTNDVQPVLANILDGAEISPPNIIFTKHATLEPIPE